MLVFIQVKLLKCYLEKIKNAYNTFQNYKMASFSELYKFCVIKILASLNYIKRKFYFSTLATKTQSKNKISWKSRMVCTYNLIKNHTTINLIALKEKKAGYYLKKQFFLNITPNVVQWVVSWSWQTWFHYRILQFTRITWKISILPTIPNIHCLWSFCNSTDHVWFSRFSPPMMSR